MDWMLKLKLQYFGHLMRRVDSLEKTLMLGGIGGRFLKEINPEYSLEWLMLKLRLQYFGHLMQRADSLEKILMLGQGGTGDFP